jgi:PTH1 family peptidyl-tRNA hydrolase
LGNPGRRYQQTRHNIGFEVIDVLACRHDIAVRQSEAQALCGQGFIGSCAVLLVKPQTYMNASGQAVAPLVRRYMHTEGCLVVIHDEIDLPLGTIKIKHRGGDAGHLGIRSIISCLDNDAFIRVRMGVGRPPQKEAIVAYVLSPFAPDEVETRDTMIAHAAASVETLVTSKHPLRQS